jgi:hypothetical protein
MRTAERAALGVLLAALAIAPAPAYASSRPEGTATQVVRGLWGFVQQLATDGPAQDQAAQPARQRPQAIAPASADEGVTIDLADLSRPISIEAKLVPAVQRPAGEMRISVPGGQARLGDFSVGSDQRIDGHLLVVRGNADIYGRLSGNLVTLEGDVILHPGAMVTGDVLALRGKVRDEGGEIDGEVRTLSAAAPHAAVPPPQPASVVGTVFRSLAGVTGVFLTLTALGLGLVMFGRHNLEVVSDTVSHSFGRSFVTGLLGQILLLPTFGMLVVGLVLSVAGILLLPFAVVVYALLVIVGVVGGYLAVAHAMGETYTRRRLALGAIGSPNSYRYLVVGLSVPLVLWLAWAVFGWVPVAGDLVRGAAILVTWLLGTAGFGAALLSRAGIRENFAGRLIPPEALTDEYLWATPQFGVPAVKRPGSTRTPTNGL